MGVIFGLKPGNYLIFINWWVLCEKIGADCVNGHFGQSFGMKYNGDWITLLKLRLNLEKYFSDYNQNVNLDIYARVLAYY